MSDFIVKVNQLGLAVPGPAGPAGPAGPPGTYYQHNQNSPNQVWNINHNLGFRPNIACFTVGGAEVIVEILHISDNQAQARFDITMAGYAICS